MKITKGKGKRAVTAEVTHTKRGDWAVEFGAYRATFPMTGPEADEWTEAGQPSDPAALPDRIGAYVKKIMTSPAHKSAGPWRGQHSDRYGAYLPLDGEESITLFPLKTRTWGPGTKSEVVAAGVTCTSLRCREIGPDGEPVDWCRIVVRFPGSASFDPRCDTYPGAAGKTGTFIENRDPAEVLEEHRAYHRENFPIHPRVALTHWIMNNAHIGAPELTEAERAEFDNQLSIAKTERCSTPMGARRAMHRDRLVCPHPCEHVLCNPAEREANRAPVQRPPSTGWRDRLDDADIRTARTARQAAQERGYGLMTDPRPARVPTLCGCPAPVDGTLPDCYWTGQHPGRAD